MILLDFSKMKLLIGHCFVLLLVILTEFNYCQGYQHSLLPHPLQQPPRITEHPVDVTVARHEPATLNCHASGEPEPVVTWYRADTAGTNGAPAGAVSQVRTAPQDARSHRVLLPAGSLFFLRVVHGRRETDGGVYWCEASNALGKARSGNATLTVAVLRDDFRLEPQSSRVAAGEDLILDCNPPRGSPEPVVTWRKDGHTLDVTEGSRLRIVDGGSLAITESRAADDGRYQCVATNPAGVRESTVALVKVHVKPYMIHPPEDITVLLGTSVEFSCGVGGDPLPDVLWRRNAPGGGAMPLGRVRVLEDRTLRLERVTLSDQGRYTCEADNPAGALTASATLVVNAPPSFSTRPLAQTVEVGQEVAFHCNAHGSPRPFVFWSFEGDRALLFPGTTNSGNFEAFANTDGHLTLVLKNAQVQQSGTVVVCSAVNLAGSVSTRTRLTVTSKEDRPPPVIMRGPVNQTLPINSPGELNCEASGTPDPIISWYKEGIPVQSSETINMTRSGKLLVSKLGKEDSGVYTCVASSRGGKATWTGHLRVENPKNPNINFFKAPEAVMLPGPPSRPHALNQSEGSVTITWGQNNKIGSSSLLGYQIELFGREDGVVPTWTIVGRRISGPTFTQHLLTSGVPYTFLVRAENGHGLGPPSQMSEAIFVGSDTAQNWGNPEVTVLSEARASLVSGTIVKLTEVIPTLSTAVKLMWEIVDSQYVEGLYIYYVALDSAPDLPRTYNMLTVLHTGTNGGFTVNNLSKWSRYEFFLVPFFKTVEGQPSNSRTVRTLEDVPIEPPTHMEALLLNASAVYLKWKSPPPPVLNGELQGFKVEVRSNGSGSMAAQVDTITVGSAPTLLLGNLTAGVSYTVKVAAATRVGLGPYSAAALLRLDPASRVVENHMQRPIADIQTGDFITETWFMALLISMVTVMIFLFGSMVLVRRKQLLSKKSTPTSRSNGAVLATPIGSKHEAPLWMDKTTTALPDFSSTLPDYSKLPQEYSRIDYNSLNGGPLKPAVTNGLGHHSSITNNGLVHHSLSLTQNNVNLHTNPLHQQQDKYIRPSQLTYSSEKNYGGNYRGNDYGNMQVVQDYASPNIEGRHNSLADYAEVDATIIGNNSKSGSTSPAPYATTTLVTRNRRIGNSLIWTPTNLTPNPLSDLPPTPSNNPYNPLDHLDEPVYPSSNGGYYNRKVYSDCYFSPNSPSSALLHCNNGHNTLRRQPRNKDKDPQSQQLQQSQQSQLQLQTQQQLNSHHQHYRGLTPTNNSSSVSIPPDLVSPSSSSVVTEEGGQSMTGSLGQQPVYARVGPPGISVFRAAGGSSGNQPALSSFSVHKQSQQQLPQQQQQQQQQPVYHPSTRSEPGGHLGN